MSMIEIDKDFSVVDEYIAQKDWKNVMRWAEEHHTVNDETTAHKVFHHQLGVKTLLDGGRRRTKNPYGVAKRTVPAGQARQ